MSQTIFTKMRVSTVLALILAPHLFLRAAELDKPTGETIVSPDARLELLFTRSAPIKGGLTEGPAAARDGRIFFSDIPFGSDKGLIMVFDPKTKETSVFTDDSGKSNGLQFDAQGFLLVMTSATGQKRVERIAHPTELIERSTDQMRRLQQDGWKVG